MANVGATVTLAMLFCTGEHWAKMFRTVVATIDHKSNFRDQLQDSGIIRQCCVCDDLRSPAQNGVTLK